MGYWCFLHRKLPSANPDPIIYYSDVMNYHIVLLLIKVYLREEHLVDRLTHRIIRIAYYLDHSILKFHQSLLKLKIICSLFISKIT